MDNGNVDVVALFKEAAYEVGGYTLDHLTLDTELADLALSSVAVMETIGFFEQRLNLRFNDDELARLTTLRDLQKLIEKAPRAA